MQDEPTVTNNTDILVSLENLKVKTSEILKRIAKIEMKVEELGSVYTTRAELAATDAKANHAVESITWITRIVLGAVVLGLIGLVLGPNVSGG